MKKLFSAIILCFIPLMAFAQVHSKVCIVRPNYSEKVIKVINDFIPNLEKLGVDDPQKYVNDFITKGSSGSGFVYVAPDGKNYIITNRHVIRDAATSTVIFEDEKTKVQKSFSGMKILAADSALDLAILEFPEGEQPFTSGFDFYKGDISDGETVYTAGFPGLINKPVWQFGTGIITNSSVEAEEMINPKYSFLIQHSAQIDGGNSGGPLLIKTQDGKYEVAGINTWKITNRQDTNFAIPASTVIKFINSVLAGEKNNSEESQSFIQEKATKLLKAINRYNVTYEELAYYISIDYVETEGKKIFDYALKKCSDDNKKTLNDILERYSPIESIRYAIGWYMFNEFHKEEFVINQTRKAAMKESKLPPIDPPEQIEDTDNWNTLLLNSYSRKVLIVTWVYTNGGWEILTVKNKNGARIIFENVPDSTSTDKTQTSKKTQPKIRTPIEIPEGKGTNLGKTVLYMPYIVQFAYGKNFFSSQTPKGLWSHTADINLKITNYLSADISAELIEESIYIYKIGEESSDNKIRYAAPYAGVQLQFPFVMTYTIAMPYIALQGGAEFSNFSNLETDFTGKAKIGSRLYASVAKNKLGLFIDANFYYKLYFTDVSQKDLGVNLSVGFAF